MLLEMQEFLMWEKASRDTIDFKKSYVDMTGDLIAGLMLSELVYWFLPSKSGGSKLRVEHDEAWWVAARLEDWWERTRISPKQARRGLDILAEKGLIIRHIYKYNGNPTTHIRLNEEIFLSTWKKILYSGPPSFEPDSGDSEGEGKTFCPTGQNGMPPGAVPLTETPTETQTRSQGERSDEEGQNGEEPDNEDILSDEAWSVEPERSGQPEEALPLPPTAPPD
ncbi:MAG: hypothetical protein M0R06_06345, partial [Sphaerochaeta sp.]|nr:hypothetical protein [Sphaerochaeta sp.]